MQKNLKFTIGVSLLILAGACSQEDDDDNGWTASRNTAVCTDTSGRRVPDSNCQNYHGSGANPFLYYYLGRNSAIPYYGETVSNGSYTRAAGQSYFRAPAGSAMSRSTAIARGGFGSSAGGHGGGGE